MSRGNVRIAFTGLKPRQTLSPIRNIAKHALFLSVKSYSIGILPKQNIYIDNRVKLQGTEVTTIDYNIQVNIEYTADVRKTITRIIIIMLEMKNEVIIVTVSRKPSIHLVAVYR